MALLSANCCFSTSHLLRTVDHSVKLPVAPIACPVQCLRLASPLTFSFRGHRHTCRRNSLLQHVHKFENAVGTSARRRQLHKGVVSMALNDNQGSSGEDMLHADEDFREATVLDAGRLYYQASVPTIFVKMEDSNLVLPIVVTAQASQMLMQALRKETGARPTMYEVIREMCAATNMEVKMVRVTGRVVDTYHARIYLAHPNSDELVSVDAKPSDAINVAVACNAKIFVNKHLMEADGVEPQYKTVWTGIAGHGFPGRNLPDLQLDVADNQHDLLAEELDLIKNMRAAAREERYADAARWRDELNKKFRTENKSRRLHRQV